jgi:hypothetical protein
MTTPLPQKDNIKAQYMEYWRLNSAMMTKCKELDARGLGKIGKTIALMRLPQAREFRNILADDYMELKRAGVTKIAMGYFLGEELAPVVARMRGSLSFWQKQVGAAGNIAFSLGVLGECALRALHIKPVRGKMFSPAP